MCFKYLLQQQTRNGVPVDNGINVVQRDRFVTIVRTWETEVSIIAGNLEKTTVVVVVIIAIEAGILVIILEVMTGSLESPSKEKMP